jgi:hypothetical protein
MARDLPTGAYAWDHGLGGDAADGVLFSLCQPFRAPVTPFPFRSHRCLLLETPAYCWCSSCLPVHGVPGAVMTGITVALTAAACFLLVRAPLHGSAVSNPHGTSPCTVRDTVSVLHQYRAIDSDGVSWHHDTMIL